MSDWTQEIMRRYWKLLFVVIPILGIMTSVGAYTMMIRSLAYSMATEFVSSHSVVLTAVGRVEKVDLAVWEGFRIRRRGPGGYARFCLDVHGSELDAKVFVFMKRDMRKWSLESAKLAVGEGERFDLISSSILQ